MKIYLGDGAYAQNDDYGDLVLTTSNGISITNRIVLGPEEIKTLLSFLEQQMPSLCSCKYGQR